MRFYNGSVYVTVTGKRCGLHRISSRYHMKKNYAKYFLALLLFGSNGIVAGMVRLDSYKIVFFRTMIGSLLLIVLFLASGRRFTFYKAPKSFAMLTVSGAAMGASWMFLYEAYQQIGVSIASLCYYCGPVIVMALAPVLFQEKLTPGKIAGFLTVLLGIAMINSQALSEGAQAFGIICGLASAVMYSLMVIFNKKCTEITGFENAALQLFISFLTVAVFTFFKQGLQISVPSDSLLPLLVLGLLNTGMGCYLYFTSISGLPVQTVAVCGYLEPLSAVLFSVAFLGEKLLPLQIAGAVFIIGGAVFCELAPQPGRKTI